MGGIWLKKKRRGVGMKQTTKQVKNRGREINSGIGRKRGREGNKNMKEGREGRTQRKRNKEER